MTDRLTTQDKSDTAAILAVKNDIQDIQSDLIRVAYKLEKLAGGYDYQEEGRDISNPLRDAKDQLTIGDRAVEYAGAYAHRAWREASKIFFSPPGSFDEAEPLTAPAKVGITTRVEISYHE